MNTCTDDHEVIATTTSTMYTDTTLPDGVEAYYRVIAYNGSGSSGASSAVNCVVATDAREEHPEALVTSRLSVLSNGIGFTFYLPQLDQASIAIYDVRGSLVATVYSEPTLAGWHRVDWKRLGRSGRVASGVYFARLYTSDRPVTQKFVLVR